MRIGSASPSNPRTRSVGRATSPSGRTYGLTTVLASAQPSAAHAAAIEDMGEAALGQFAAPTHRIATDPGFQPRPVGADRFLGGVIAAPAKIAVGRLGSAMRVLPTPPSSAFSGSRAWQPFVSDQHAGSFSLGASPTLARLQARPPASERRRRRVALVGRMDRRRHHDARVEIDRVLGFIGQMRRSILHPGHLRLRVGRALPVRVRQRLALAVEPRQLLGVSVPLSVAIRVSIAR